MLKPKNFARWILSFVSFYPLDNQVAFFRPISTIKQTFGAAAEESLWPALRMMSASISLGAQIPTTLVLYLFGSFGLATGAALVSLVLYFLFKNAASVLRWLGEIGTLVMMRLMAFILLCVGIQFMWNGWAELNGMKL